MRWYPKKRRPASRRILAHEPLESRQLLAANWMHNVPLPEDVDGDGAVAPRDALYVVNALNRNQATTEGESTPSFLDVNDDSLLTPVDALHVVNRLNGPAWKNRPSVSLGSRLSGDGTEEGKACYVEWSLGDDQTERLFEVKVEGATASSTFEVTLEGMVVGQLETDEEGEGKLVISSSPKGNQLPLPDDFPDVTAGMAVSVGEILTGELSTHPAGKQPEKPNHREVLLVLGSRLSGDGPEEGKACYVEWSLGDDQTERLFEVKVEGATASSTFEVTLEGMVVGQLETDEEGEGKLVFSSSPKGNQLPLPDDFPDVTAGMAVSVGEILTGELADHERPSSQGMIPTNGHAHFRSSGSNRHQH